MSDKDREQVLCLGRELLKDVYYTDLQYLNDELNTMVEAAQKNTLAHIVSKIKVNNYYYIEGVDCTRLVSGVVVSQWLLDFIAYYENNIKIIASEDYKRVIFAGADGISDTFFEVRCIREDLKMSKIEKRMHPLMYLDVDTSGDFKERETVPFDLSSC